MPATALEIRVLPIEQLIPAEYNPRRVLRPGQPAYRKLRASLEQFGLVEPLVWNESTGRLVGGHARLRILQELGTTQVPVSVVRLSESHERALNIMLNNLEAQSRFDIPQLAAVLEELRALDELELTGFEMDDLRTLQLEPLPTPPAEPELARVEVALIMSTATYLHVRERLDDLVKQFDLESHVRHAPANHVGA